LRAPSPKTWRILTITRTDHLFSVDTGTTTATGAGRMTSSDACQFPAGVRG
jgi:hypothetical protein